MFNAIATGNVAGVQMIIREIYDMPATRRRAVLEDKLNGKTLLHAAITAGNMQIFHDIFALYDACRIKFDTPDNEGNTPLYDAVAIGSLEMVKDIVAQDVPLNIVNNAGQTACEFAAVKVAAQLPNHQDYKSIVALLRTRLEWQDASVGKIRFNRVVGLIEKAFPAINPAGGTDKLLCIGSTDAGKSTLLNYLNGTKYTTGVHKTKPFARPIGGEPELFKVGLGMSSETLYPQINIIPGLNFSYCDLAGLADSRGDSERVCAASSVQMLSRLPGNIKGILLVLDIPSFNAQKGASFKSTAIALAQMVANDPTLMDSVSFAITKLPPSSRDAYGHISTTTEDILETYVVPLLESLSNDQTSDGIALKFMLEQMVLNSNNIIIPDITDQGQSRNALQQKISAFEAKDAGRYSFISHDGSQQAFTDTLQAIGEGYLARRQEVTVRIPNRIHEEEHREIDINERIRNIEEELRQRRVGDAGFNAVELNRLIAQKHDQIRTNEDTIRGRNESVRDLERDIVTMKHRLSILNTDEMVRVGALAYPIHGRAREHNLRYQSRFPCYGPASVGGFFWGYGKLSSSLLPECNAMSGLYSAMIYASEGLDRVDVTFQTQKKYIEAANISLLHINISEARRANVNSNSEIHRLTNQNEQLRREIIACETEKIQGEANAQIRDERIQGEIRVREQWLLEAIAQLEACIAEQRTLSNLRQDIQCEIAVNDDLFEIIYQVSKVLDLGAVEAIENFWNEYEIVNPGAREAYDAWLHNMNHMDEQAAPNVARLRLQ